MGPNFFSWDGMGPNLCGMGAPGPVPALCQDRDGTRSWWDGSSHPGPTASLEQHEKIKKVYESNHSKLIMLNAQLVNSELSKSFSDLRVTSLSNRIRCIVRD